MQQSLFVRKDNFWPDSWKNVGGTRERVTSQIEVGYIELHYCLDMH